MGDIDSVNSNEEAKISFSKLAPFDSSSTDHLSMYDNLPYKRNSDVCNGEAVTKETGNVLKFYRCRLENPYEISNRDDSTYKMLSKLRKEQTPSAPSENTEPEAAPVSNGITEEQMDELFRDNES